MSDDPLRRLEGDLAVMRAAIGDELPFDRSHAVLQLLTGAFGLPLLLLPWLGLEAYVLRGVLLFDGLLAVVWLWQYRSAKANRFERPAAWRTARLEATSALLIGGLLLMFAAWLYYLNHQHAELKSASRLVTATMLFVLGLAGLTWVLLDRRHLPSAAWFVALMVMGIAAPLCERVEQSWMVYGACIIVGGVSAGLLEFRQLRRVKVAHAD